MIDVKEKTALATSVGADERQSIQLCNANIITTENTEINYPDENSSENFSKDQQRGTGSRYRGGDSGLSAQRRNPLSDPEIPLWDFCMGGICTGDLLVLPASGDQISENREHESI